MIMIKDGNFGSIGVLINHMDIDRFPLNCKKVFSSIFGDDLFLVDCNRLSIDNIIMHVIIL